MEKTPRTAKGFASLWLCNEDALIDGNQTIPDMHRRQSRLIGKTLDACIVLHVYEQIKQGHDFDSLRSFFPAKFSEKNFESLCNLSDADKQQELVKMVQRPDDGKWLKSHYDLVKDKVWNEYTLNLKSYTQKAKIWASEIDAHSRRHTEHTLPEKPTIPEDPRIKAINDKIRPTICIYNSGAKEPTSISRKLKSKKANMSEIRDINRITVLPTKPEYGDDFINIMHLLNPAKAVDKDQIPRFFAEEAELRDNGYYNQKLFIALDGSVTKGGITNDNMGTIAEIKILPAEMLKADKLSAPANAVSRVIRDFLNEIAEGNSPSKEDMLVFSKTLNSLCSHKKSDFEKLNQECGKDYDWPDFPKHNLNDIATYHKLQKDFFDLEAKIHTDVIASDKNGWQEPYLKTAIKQQLATNEANKAKIHEATKSDLPRTEQLTNFHLNEIVKNGSWNLANLEKEVRKELQLPKSTRQK